MLHTGQHYDDNMSAVFFEELGIPEPAYNLGIGSGSHATQTGRQLIEIEEVLLAERPDCVLVYGDTNSTLAGALAAAKLNLPLAHVEAGLRSFRRDMPEEINRILTDHCSTLLFAPTPVAVDNLRREGIPDTAIHLVGDVMYDVALEQADRARTASTIVRRLDLEPRRFILATIHRAVNTDNPDRLRAILDGLAITARDCPVVFPVHPRTRPLVDRLIASVDSRPHCAANGSLKLIPPVGYLDMVALESQAAVIATDSGGVQKEAFFHQTPCVTLREETEWTELIDADWNRLCPPLSADRIRDTILAALGTRGRDIQPYGDGHAARRIAEVLVGNGLCRKTEDRGRKTEDRGVGQKRIDD